MFLRILNGPLAGQTFELKEGENTIGRTKECDIVLNLPGISKKHAVINYAPGNITITDLGSSNGTFVNGIRVRQKTLSTKDRMGFHQCLADLKIVTKAPTMERTGASQVGAWDGNAALQIPQAEQSPAPAAVQNQLENIQNYVNTVAMPGIYRLIEMFEYRNVLASFIVGFILLMTMFSIVPMMNITKNSIEQESRRRALTIAKNLAISNQSLLQQGTESAVSTRAAENEEGVQSALIISNRDGHTIAPAINAGSYANLPFVHKARKLSRESVEQIDDSTIGASYPIHAYNPESGQQVIAHAVVLYGMGGLAIDSARYISLFTQILFISFLLGACLFFILYKLHKEPLLNLNQQLDAALKDDRQNLTTKYMIPELNQLVVNINSALSRTGSNGSAPLRIDRSTEAQNIVQMFNHPCLTLDKDQLFLSVNNPLEDLIGMRFNTLQGQSLEILSDQAFKMSIVDLINQAALQPGMIVSNNLDFAGILYEIDTQAILGSTEISYYLISMKKAGESL
ncbi:MAG: FHA domain-containing protein [Bdellovibrionales bacterium]